MGFRIIDIGKNRNKINKQLLLEIERVLPEMNSIGLSNCIWYLLIIIILFLLLWFIIRSLGKIQQNYELIPISIRAKIENIILKMNLEYLSISNILIGLSSMNFNYNNNNNSLIINHILSSLNDYDKVSKSRKQLNEQIVSNIIYSLGNMKVHFSSLSNDTISSLFVIIDKVINELSVQGLSNILFGLNKMGFTCETIPLQTINNLFSIIPSIDFHERNTIALANIIYSLG